MGWGRIFDVRISTPTRRERTDLSVARASEESASDLLNVGLHEPACNGGRNGSTRLMRQAQF
jgi:hypothetical protein